MYNYDDPIVNYRFQSSFLLYRRTKYPLVYMLIHVLVWSFKYKQKKKKQVVRKLISERPDLMFFLEHLYLNFHEIKVDSVGFTI